MADTTYAYNPTGANLGAIDRVAGVDYPYYKIKWGAPGTLNDADIASGKPFPIQLRGSDGTDRSNLLPVSGTVTANQGGAPWSVTMTSTTITGTVTVTGTVAATQSGSWTAAITAAASAFADGALVTLGLKTDARSTSTDGTSVPAMSIWKQISFSIQALATALGSAVLDRGAGASTANTIRTVLASDQVDGGKYEACPASSTTTLGSTGAIGDYLSQIIIVPGSVSPGAVSIKDGGDTAIVIFPGGTNSMSNLVSPEYNINANSRTGAWQIVTGAGVTVFASGTFT